MPKPNPPPNEIVVTTQEKALYEALIYVQSITSKFDYFKIKRGHLPVGDVVYANLVGERKEIRDFTASVKDGRVFEQSQNMTLNYEFVYLLIEGSPNEVEADRDLKAIYTTLADVELRYNIRHQWCKDLEFMAYYFLALCLKLMKRVKPKWHVIRITPKLEDEKESVLRGIKGIGRITARRALEKFRSLKNFFNASIEELKELDQRFPAQHVKEVFESEETKPEESNIDVTELDENDK